MTARPKKHSVYRIRRRHPAGSAPGQVHARPSDPSPTVRAICYDRDSLDDWSGVEVAGLAGRCRPGRVLWVDVVGLGSASLIVDIGRQFGLHNLALEDVVNTHQRPKADDYSGHVYIVLSMPRADTGLDTEQVSLFLGENFVITFQERPGDCFDLVRQRLATDASPIRTAGADYLAYRLIDAVIDSYFPLLEDYGERLEELENDVVRSPRAALVGQLHELKRDLLMLRRIIWPHRDMINSLLRDQHHLLTPETRLFLRDCYDHIVQLMDLVETYREMVSALLDVYISSVGVRQNEVMKVLTVVATLFMPLGFIAGLYGMNFDRGVSPWNMPELSWRYGYPFALALMAIAAGGLVWYIWRKGWLDDDGA